MKKRSAPSWQQQAPLVARRADAKDIDGQIRSLLRHLKRQQADLAKANDVRRPIIEGIIATTFERLRVLTDRLNADPIPLEEEPRVLLGNAWYTPRVMRSLPVIIAKRHNFDVQAGRPLDPIVDRPVTGGGKRTKAMPYSERVRLLRKQQAERKRERGEELTPQDRRDLRG